MKMSKKQNNKKKINVRIAPGQAVYVADVLTLNHIMDLYYTMASQAETEEDKAAWVSVGDQIYSAIQDTYYDFEDTYEEEW